MVVLDRLPVEDKQIRNIIDLNQNLKNNFTLDLYLFLCVVFYVEVLKDVLLVLGTPGLGFSGGRGVVTWGKGSLGWVRESISVRIEGCGV